MAPQITICPTITADNRDQVNAARHLPRPPKRPPPKHEMKSCSKCEQYQRGRGQPACLKCRNYTDIEDVQALNRSIQITPVVSALLEAVPAPQRPDNLLHATVQALPRDDAAIISMHYYGALSVREVAAVLRISQPAARSKLYRAVQQLYKNISEQYPGVKTKIDAKMQLLMSHTYI